jgi:hypothetical protein
MTLFKEMMVRKMTVREAEQIARRIAYEKVRKKDLFMTPEVVDMEERLAETLGTRVQIEPRERGGRISIDYFSHEELLAISIAIRKAGEQKTHKGMFDTLRDEDMETLQAVAPSPRHIEPITEFTHLNHIETVHEASPEIIPSTHNTPIVTTSEAIELDDYISNEIPEVTHTVEVAEDDRSLDEVKSDEQDEDLYSVKNFAL